MRVAMLRGNGVFGSRLAGRIDVQQTPHPTLFQAALGARWFDLPAEVQALHSVQDVESFSGTAQVTRGESLIARLAAWFFGFPAAADAVPVTITKTRTPTGEIWERDFGGRVFRSYLTRSPLACHYRERFWLSTSSRNCPWTRAACAFRFAAAGSWECLCRPRCCPEAIAGNTPTEAHSTSMSPLARRSGEA